MATFGRKEGSTPLLLFLLVLLTTSLASYGWAQETAAPAYVKVETCTECHQDAYKTWQGSHHDWALRDATEGNVLGDFDNQTFEIYGVTSRFFRRDGAYFVETLGPDGKLAEFEIKYTVGVTPLQQYLVELEGGRLQALDLTWDVLGKRWYHLYPKEKITADDGLHWTGPYKNWNGRCAVCHQTNYVKGYDPQTKTYKTTWSDANVGCEACHGPGEAHVAWARDPAKFEAARFADVDKLGLTVKLDGKDPQKEIELCAPCHSRRAPLGADSPPPGSRFADHHDTALLRQDLYHPDGQILEEVYVYGSLLQSKMYAAGVHCSNCHDPHSGALKAEGNAICTQCHSPDGHAEFPTLKLAAYDSPDHHRHKEGSAGAQCVNCHMPDQNYMIVDPRRDHSFRVPRPDLSVALGTPNACTMCHEDKDADWAAARGAAWYPKGQAGKPHFGEVFAATREGVDESTRGKLMDIAAGSKEPAIVRATALDRLRGVSDPSLAEKAAPLLKDKNPLLRKAAIALQAPATEPDRIQRIAPLLKDPIRSVRIAAARALISLPVASIPPDSRDAMQSAVGEHQHSLAALSDFPETQMNMAGLALGFRNLPAAKEALHTALAMDAQLENAWYMLARIELAEGRLEDSRNTLQKGIAAMPETGILHQALGGIFLRLGQEEQALASLKTAQRLLPENPSVLGDLGILYTRRKETDKAIEVLTRAYEIQPSDPELLYLLASNHLTKGDRQSAEFYAFVLATKYPDHPLRTQLDRAIQGAPKK